MVPTVFGQIPNGHHSLGIVVAHDIVPGPVIPYPDQVFGVAADFVLVELFNFLAELLYMLIVHMVTSWENQGAERLFGYSNGGRI